MKGFKGLLSATLDIVLVAGLSVVCSACVVGAAMIFVAGDYPWVFGLVLGFAAYGCIRTAYIHLIRLADRVWL